jgi:hypothetical protein
VISIGKFIFETVGGKVLLSGIGVIALVVWWQVERAGQRQVGRLEQKLETEKTNAKVVKRAAGVRSAVTDRGVQGRIDPFAVDK